LIRAGKHNPFRLERGHIDPVPLANPLDRDAAVGRRRPFRLGVDRFGNPAREPARFLQRLRARAPIRAELPSVVVDLALELPEQVAPRLELGLLALTPLRFELRERCLELPFTLREAEARLRKLLPLAGNFRFEASQLLDQDAQIALAARQKVPRALEHSAVHAESLRHLDRAAPPR